MYRGRPACLANRWRRRCRGFLSTAGLPSSPTNLRASLTTLRCFLTGLVGEAGGVLVEFKKRVRDGAAYPHDQARLCEELGDLLWYFVRIVQMRMPSLIEMLDGERASTPPPAGAVRFPARPVGHSGMQRAIPLSTAASNLLAEERNTADVPALMALWEVLVGVATMAGVSMQEVAEQNIRKRDSRWPAERRYAPLFDGAFPEEEQLPRRLEIEFRELGSTDKPTVVIRCNGLNVGDRLTDNIQSADDYRFHDVLHFAHMAYLGWSPVLRSVFKCKRKSSSDIDENEDGARAGIVEEAVSAMVFNRAKEVSFFRDIDEVDYDLLKAIAALVRGFEVERVPLWQWDEAIRRGYDVFRQLKEQGGGRLSLDLEAHDLSYLRS